VRRSISTHLLADVTQVVSENDIIGIDEGQFYPDLVSTVQQWLSMNKIVIVSALDGDFQQQPFGQVLQLIPLAEKITKLNAVCHVCTADAPFSRRITTETNQQVIGGDDKYIACCRQCLVMDVSSMTCALEEHRAALKRSVELKACLF
jgi:thymidine kinase